MSRRFIVIAIAPASPPCFSSRDQWLEFLVSAAEEQTPSRRGPIDMRFDDPRFNTEFDFCADCTAKHALAMQAQGRCQPQWLKEPSKDTA